MWRPSQSRRRSGGGGLIRAGLTAALPEPRQGHRLSKVVTTRLKAGFANCRMADPQAPKTPRRRRLPISNQELHRLLYLQRKPQHRFPVLRKVIIGLLITIMAAFVLYVTWIIAQPPPKGVRLVIGGERGLSVAGTLSIDGRERPLNLTVPANYHFAARDLSLTLKRAGGAGDLSLTVFLDGKQRSSVNSTAPAGGVWVEMRHGVFEKRYESGTFEFKR